MRTSHPLGSESSDTLLVVDWCRAKKCTQILRIDADLSIRGGALNEWPIIPRRPGLHLVVRDGRKQSTFRLIMDQARCVKLPRGTMGCGLKLVQSNCDAALPFCIVAVCSTEERLAEAYKQLPGGESGYGELRTKTKICVYDIARSLAYLVNCRPAPTHKLCMPATLWTASFRARAKNPSPDHLFAPYGVGSDQHAIIKVAKRERDARAPVCNRKKADLKRKMSALRECRGQ